MNKHIQTILAMNHLDEAGQSWLRDGLISFLKSDDQLHKCLGISRSNDMRILRDSYIVKSWVCFSNKNTPWNACKKLEKELKKFETTVWPRLHNKLKPEVSWSNLRTYMFWICWYSNNGNIPGAKQISNVVKSAGMYISQVKNDSY